MGSFLLPDVSFDKLLYPVLPTRLTSSLDGLRDVVREGLMDEWSDR